MRFKTPEKIPEYVSGCLQLALLLEVSAYPKPGNVHRTADFAGTRYEHFLASAVATGTSLRKAAEKGVILSSDKMRLSEVEVGKLIREAVEDISSWQHGGNTLLGSMILLTPIAVSAGTSLTRGENLVADLRRNLRSVVESTTPEDAVNLYDAINIAQPGGLGRAPTLDVADATSRQRIQSENVSLYEVFKISAPWDSISAEWVTNYHITFDIGYPFLTEQMKATKDPNVLTNHTFLKILSEVPDTLIARKTGSDKAKEVSNEAKRILEAGGLAASEGRKMLQRFDQKLRDPAHKLNPGTTADLTSAVLALATLDGYRP